MGGIDKKIAVKVTAVIMGSTFAFSATSATAYPISAVALTEPQTSRYAGYTEETMQKYFEDKMLPMVVEFSKATYKPELEPLHIYFIPKGKSKLSFCKNRNSNDNYFDADAYDYCPASDTVYLGQKSMGILYNDVDAIAPIISLAHEWGHAIQSKKGVRDPTIDGKIIQHENQADCVAGAWIKYALQQGWIEPKDLPIIDKLVDYLARIEGANHEHGTPEKRRDAMLQGRHGGLKACNSYYPETPII